MQSGWQVLACFAAGLFLTNGIPHFVKGLCGDRFPTPFAKPPGKGLSSATLNVAWGIGNFAASLLLAHAGQLLCGPALGRWIAAAAAAIFALGTSAQFARKEKE
jgi:hypothetical protein